MQLILEEVREQLFYFPTVYREKNLDTNVLVLGGGESDIIYKAGINRYNEVFVELKFHENTKDIFNALLLEKQEIDEKFDYLIDWDMRWYRIYSIYPYCRSNEKRIIKRQVRILDKLVKFFADFRNCSI